MFTRDYFKTTHTLAEDLSRLVALICNGPTLYRAELNLRTYRVKFWRDAHYMGALSWDVRRRHCQGHLDLDEEAEPFDVLVQDLEEELRRAMQANNLASLN